MSLTFVVGIFVFITGLCIGSFLNVVILRALSEESIVFPASKCPKCQTPLKWWHNIPVLSYIFLRGKCAFCKEKISIQYPIIELLTGYLFLSSYLKFGITFKTLFVVMFLSMFIVIATTDIKERVSFDVHCYILAVFGLIYNFFNFGNLYSGHTGVFNTSFVVSILGLIVGAGIIALYYSLGYLILKATVIGSGDIFIAGALGACFGWKYILYILLLAFVIQIVITVPIFFAKLIKQKDYLTVFSFFTFLIFSFTYWLVAKYTNLYSNMFIYIVLTLLLVIFGAFLCKLIFASLPKNLDEAENTPQDGIRIAFGPALVSAGLLFIFLF